MQSNEAPYAAPEPSPYQTAIDSLSNFAHPFIQDLKEFTPSDLVAGYCVASGLIELVSGAITREQDELSALKSAAKTVIGFAIGTMNRR